MSSAVAILRTLKRLAREQRIQPQALLTRFGLERFLYRLSQWELSQPAALLHGRGPTTGREPDGFTLKGAWCFVAWGGDLHRPTKDIDLRRVGNASEATLRRIFSEACAIDGADDVVFDDGSIETRLLEQTALYTGVELKLHGLLGPKTRLKIKVDVVPGDAVVPEPVTRTRLTTLVPGLPEPLLHVYSRESVVAEKLHAIATLGMLNSRLKDYWDLHHLALDPLGFDGRALSRAILTTFARRDRQRPPAHLDGLSDTYVQLRASQWAFTTGLTDVMSDLRRFVLPLLAATTTGAELVGRWDHRRGWQEPLS